MGDEGKGIQCVISKEVKSIIALKNYFPVSVEDDSYLNKFKFSVFSKRYNNSFLKFGFLFIFKTVLCRTISKFYILTPDSSSYSLFGQDALFSSD